MQKHTDVAKAAGVTKGAACHYQQNKEQVLQVALKNLFETALDRARRTAQERAEMPEESMKRLLQTSSELWMERRFLAAFSSSSGKAEALRRSLAPVF